MQMFVYFIHQLADDEFAETDASFGMSIKFM